MSETILERTSDSHYANLSALMFLEHYETEKYSKIEKCQENCYKDSTIYCGMVSIISIPVRGVIS